MQFTVLPESQGTFAVYLGSMLIFGGLGLLQAFALAGINVLEARDAD